MPIFCLNLSKIFPKSPKGSWLKLKFNICLWFHTAQLDKNIFPPGAQTSVDIKKSGKSCNNVEVSI